MREWREVRLSDVMKIIGGGTPKTNNTEFWDGEIPWLSVMDINNNSRWVDETEKHITKAGLTQSSTRLLKSGQLIISARGTVGCLAQLKKDMAFNQSCYGLSAKPEIATNDFLYYALSNIIDDLRRAAHGAVFDTITRSTFDHLSLSLPDLDYQQTVAEILTSLDQKIALNQRMCKTLEATAGALFKSWFVDFDPVHAKMRGEQPYGMDAQTAALFPDRFVESELGLIPEGWVVDELGNYVNFLYGKPLKEENRVTGQYPVYGSNGIIGYHHEFLVNYSGIVIGRKGNPGVVKLSTQGFYAIDTTFYAEITEKLPSIFFWYHSLLHLELSRLSSDSAVPGLNRNSAYKCRVIIPCKQTVSQFHEFAGTIYEKIRSYESETKILIELRDSLLPKLMSGEVSVK